MHLTLISARRDTLDAMAQTLFLLGLSSVIHSDSNAVLSDGLVPHCMYIMSQDAMPMLLLDC